MNDIEKVLNTSVPIYDMVTLSFDEMLMCADNNEEVESNINSAIDYMHERIHYTSGLAYHRVDDPMLQSFVICADKKDSLTKVYFNPMDYFMTLERVLNIPTDKLSNNFHDQDLIDLLNERIDKLSSVKTYDELRVEFPMLWDDYNLGKAKCSTYTRLLASDIESENKLGDTLQVEYERCCLANYFYRFINRQAMMYRRYVTNFDKIVKYCSNFSHHNKTNNYKYLTGLNPYKLKLLLASKYINLAVIKNDKETAQEIMPFLVNFLNDITNYHTTILVNGEAFTYSDVEAFYKYFMKKFDLIPFTCDRDKFLGLTKEEVDEIVEKELDAVSIVKANRGIRRVINHTGVTHGPRQERDLTTLRKLLEDKQNLFENSDYIEKFFSEDGYDGYIYFVYPNGIILRDKFYGSYKNNVPADDEAWYRSQIEHFFRIHNLNKQTLIRTNNDIVQRHYHSTDWEVTARDYIQKQTLTPLADVEDFIIQVRDQNILVPTKNKKLF